MTFSKPFWMHQQQNHDSVRHSVVLNIGDLLNDLKHIYLLSSLDFAK